MLDRLARHTSLQLALVVLVAACVYLPFLGVRPLDFSEGHRAVPAWTMLESHDYWHQQMFGLTYIRKPPGMAWAIAASSAWLGETPFAARLPSAISAILMSVVAWWYGRRWFGMGGTGGRDGSPSLAGVSAGLAQALMPLMWSPGRTAEIEMLNNLGTQMFALGLVDLLLRGTSRGGAEIAEEERESSPFAFLGELCASARDVLFPTAGLLIAALAKGPASAPVLGGVMLGACVAARSIRPLRNGSVWVAIIFGAGAIALLGMKFLIANNDPDAVREDVAGQFLWSAVRVMGVLTLVPLAFASALPTSLALLVPKGTSNARAGGEGVLARTLVWAWLCSLAILMLSGVSNARYAMPAAVLLPPLVPFAIGALRPRLAQPAAEGTLTAIVRRAAASPACWAGTLAMGAWWFLLLTAVSPTADQQAGIGAATLLAPRQGASGRELWVNDVIEARPDVVWMISKGSPHVNVRWMRAAMLRGELPPPGTLLLLRTDRGSVEWDRYFPKAKSQLLELRESAKVRDYRFTLYCDRPWDARPLTAPRDRQ